MDPIVRSLHVILVIGLAVIGFKCIQVVYNAWIIHHRRHKRIWVYCIKCKTIYHMPIYKIHKNKYLCRKCGDDAFLREVMPD